MELLIVRHGPAGTREDWRPSGRPDSERPLTKDGVRKTKAAARGLVVILDGLDLVATSPWTRASQTADLVAKPFRAPVEPRPELIPDRASADLLAWLKTRREKRIALVGHEPHLSRFASWLMTGRETPVLTLKKSQAVLLELGAVKAGGATLLWSLPPRFLRALA